METIQILTKVDLEEFKKELLQELKKVVQPQGIQPKQLMKSVEVRKLLNISPSTLQNLRINGTLPYTKVGSIMYYKQEDIIKILNANLK